MIRPSEWLERLNVADLSPEAKTLLKLMLDHARERGGYGVPVPDHHLVTLSGMSNKMIIEKLYEAFRAGWVHARVYAYGTKPQTSSTYILAVPTIQVARKPRVARKAKVEMTLKEWEAQNGQLVFSMVEQWAKQKGFCPELLRQLVEEFRLEMTSKSKLYADFKATFQTYLNKGYLSLKPQQVLLINSPYAPKIGAGGKAASFGVGA